LASRISSDYLRKGKNLGKRPIELAIKKYGLSNFRLEVYVLSQELLNQIYPKLHSTLTPEGELEGILPKSQIKGVAPLRYFFPLFFNRNIYIRVIKIIYLKKEEKNRRRGRSI